MAVKNRQYIQLSDEMKDYVEKMALSFGISQSGFINIVLSQYRQQCQVTNAMIDIGQTLDRLEKLSSGIKGDSSH